MDAIVFELFENRFGVPASEIDTVIFIKGKDILKKNNSFVFNNKKIVPFENIDMDFIRTHKHNFIAFVVKNMDILFFSGSKRAEIEKDIHYKELKPYNWFPSFYIGANENILLIDVYEYIEYYEKNI